MSAAKQKGSLASLAQKKKGIQKLKTVLSRPFPRYLPKVQLEDLQTIKDLIIYDKQKYKQVNYIKYRGLYTGLNTIIRLLKKNKISCLLLSSDIKPFSILYQIITLALNTSQPSTYILYVPNLNEIIKEVFHTDSFALASAREKFVKLEEYMKIKTLEFPLPNKWLIYHGLYRSQPEQLEQNKISKDNLINKIDVNELYVMKPHKYFSRSFYPKNANNLKPLKFEEPEEFSSNYISISNTECQIERDLINYTTNYKTDKHNLINCIGNHMCTSIDIKMTNVKIPLNQEEISNKRKTEKAKLNENLNKNSVIQYEPLKLKKIQRNCKKKHSQIKNRSNLL